MHPGLEKRAHPVFFYTFERFLEWWDEHATDAMKEESDFAKVYRRAYNKIRTRDWVSKNRDRARQHRRDYYKRNPEPSKRGAARRRAVKAGAFIEDVEDLLIFDWFDGVCQI